MESKRLPDKVLLDISGKPMLYHIIQRSRKISDRVLVATSCTKENHSLIDFCMYMNCDVFIGSLDNVLDRIYNAVHGLSIDYIVRITADNPFIDVFYGSYALQLAIEKDSDVLAFCDLPTGIAVEIIKKEALEIAYKEASKNYHFEHVTPYLWENPDRFKIDYLRTGFKSPFKNLRLTVDTIEDLSLARLIYTNLYKGKIFDLNNIITLLRKNPYFVTINSNIEQKMIYTHNVSCI